MDKDTTPAPVSNASIADAANATGEAANKVDGAASKVEDAASSAGDSDTSKTLAELNAGLKGLSTALEGIANDIRAMKPTATPATPETPTEPTGGDTNTMGEPEIASSPVPPEKVKKGTYHKRKARMIEKRGGKK